MARLLVLRHGESQWNLEGRWQGHADPPLTERGERQARRAAAAITGAARVVASDLQRAHRTAELIAGALGLGAVTLQAALRERDVGEWSGLTATEVDAAFPGYRAEGRTPPGWESDAALVARAEPALVALGSPPGPTVVVVTHGGVVRAIEQHLGAPLVTSANLEGRWLEVTAGGLRLGERVALADGE